MKQNILLIILVAGMIACLYFMGTIMDKCVKNGGDIRYSYRGHGVSPTCSYKK